MLILLKPAVQPRSAEVSRDFQGVFASGLSSPAFLPNRFLLHSESESATCSYTSWQSIYFDACSIGRRNAGSRVLKKGWHVKIVQRLYGRGLEKAGGYCRGYKMEKGAGVRFQSFSGRKREWLECGVTSHPSEAVTIIAQTSAGSDSRAAASPSMEGKTLWSKLSQSVNLSGVYFSVRVIIKERHLAIPHVCVPDISWVDWKALRARGFEGVLFDKDNTLTAPYAETLWAPLNHSLNECRTVFGGRIALLSNSAGLFQYDPEGAEAKVLEDRLGIPVIRHGQKKPAGNALALSNYFDCDPSMLIMVGDRYFTDIVYGNRNGLLTVRPAPLTIKGEPYIVQKVRVLEETLVKRWSQRGILPTKHKLSDNPIEFIKDPGCW